MASSSSSSSGERGIKHLPTDPRSQHSLEDPINKIEALSSSPAIGPQSIPNGGFVAWLQVFCGFFCFFNSWGLVNTFGVFQDYYYSSLIPDVTNSNISWIGAIQAFLLCATTVFVGPIFDHGHSRMLVATGSIVAVFGMMMTSLCSQYWQLMLAQGLCVGIGSGCLFLPAIAIIPSYFTTKRAFATGIAASGSSLGGIIYPIIFYHLQPRIGFGWSTRVLGFIMLATSIVPCVCMKARPSHGKPSKRFDFAAFKEPAFSLFCVASFIGFIGLYVPFFYVSAYATKSGLGAVISFYMLPIMSAGSLLGRILPGTIANRTGPLNLLGLCTLVAGILGLCWIAVGRSTGGLIVWSIIYGAFSGSFVSLQPPSVVSVTADLSTVGGRMGLNTFCAALGILIGTPIAGVLVGQGSWVGMQAFCGGTLAASSVLIILTRWIFVWSTSKSKA
jgi:MFS family permease